MLIKLFGRDNIFLNNKAPISRELFLLHSFSLKKNRIGSFLSLENEATQSGNLKKIRGQHYFFNRTVSWVIQSEPV
jgi:hypothetical protein